MLMKTPIIVTFICAGLLFINMSYGAEPEILKFRGVVTYHLLPAKVMRVNEIVEDPKPGTSYIGDKGILVELDRNIDVRANWTVVDIEYYRYVEPKTITYELFGEVHKITVNYHAESVNIAGDISEYIEK